MLKGSWVIALLIGILAVGPNKQEVSMLILLWRNVNMNGKVILVWEYEYNGALN